MKYEMDSVCFVHAVFYERIQNDSKCITNDNHKETNQNMVWHTRNTQNIKSTDAILIIVNNGAANVDAD